MMLLPKGYQFLKMPCSGQKYVPHIGFASVAGPDGVCSVGEGDPAVRAKIDDDFDLGIESMHMPRRMIHRVGRKPNAIEPDRTHLSHINPSPLGYEELKKYWLN
jgi:hypothetical protein